MKFIRNDEVFDKDVLSPFLFSFADEMIEDALVLRDAGIGNLLYFYLLQDMGKDMQT